MTTALSRPVPLLTYSAVMLRIWLRSPVRRVLIAVAVFMLATCGLQLSTGQESWDESLAYLNLWVVAAGPVFVAVMTGYLAHIDRADRSGGTDLRNIPRPHRLLGRAFITTIFSTLLNITAIALWFILSAIFVHGVSVTTALVIALSLSVSYVWYCAVLSFVSTFSPVLGPAIVALGTVVVGIKVSESSHWFLFPPAWIYRSTLGLIGTHTSGTGLAGDALPAGPVPFVGSLVLAGVLLAVLAPLAATGFRASSGADSRGISGPMSRALSSSSGVTGAVASMIRGGTIPLLAVLAIGFTELVIRWRTMSDSAEIFGLLVLPLGCTILSTLWVHRVCSASRALACRSPLPEAIGVRLLGFMNLVIVTIVAATALVFVAAGMPLASALTQSLVLICVGSSLIGITALVAVTLGTVATISFGVIGTIFGVLVGGTDTYPSVKAVLPFAWAAHPLDAHLLPLLPVSLVLAALTSVLAARGLYPARRR